MSDYSDFENSNSTDEKVDREALITVSEHRKKFNANQTESRNNAREKQKVTKEWAKEISQLTVEELIIAAEELPMYEKRTINNTSTMNRREIVIMNLAKKISGGSIRQILIDACQDIIRESSLVKKSESESE